VCRGFFRALNPDGSVATFAATPQKIYMLDATSLGWVDVSKGGASYPALSSTDNWQFCQFVNHVIAVQANTVPQVFTLEQSTAFSDLGGTPPQARYITVVGFFVVLTGLVTNPFRVQWSALNNDQSWTPGLNSADFQDLPDGGVVRGVAGGEYGNIFQDTVIRRMIYAPGSDVIFQIERISEDRGIFMPYSLIRSGDQIFWLAAQGYMQMAPTGYPQPIGKERVDRTVLAEIDSNAPIYCVGASDPQNSRVFWTYKTVTFTGAGFNKMLCYDYALQKFTAGMIKGQFLGSISQPGYTLDGLDSISLSIDALPASLDSYVVSTTPQIAMVDMNFTLGFLHGPPLEATVATGAMAQPGRRMFMRAIRPLTNAATVFGSIGGRSRLADTELFTGETPMDIDTGQCPTRIDTRYARAKLRIPAGTLWSFASGIEADFDIAGAR
jgi:hypothetical protein